ncbi:MAG: LPS export ABC transporter periplasmic protein LptC, partial [Pseudorhodoplanes sp.]
MNRMLAGPEDRSQHGLPSQGKPPLIFSGARRHSRRVRFLRKAVPLTLVLVAGGLVAVNYLNPMRWLRVPTEFGTLVISGSKITMEAPRLAGFTKERREYEVSASAASQDTRNPNVVEMKEISGRMGMQDDSTVTMTAVEGVYDVKGDLLTLTQEIVILSTAGYQGRLTEAKVEIKKGRIVSEKPVQLKMPQGTLDANRMEVLNSGELIRFEGGVVMMLAPEVVNKGIKQDTP